MRIEYLILTDGFIISYFSKRVLKFQYSLLQDEYIYIYILLYGDIIV